MNKKTSIIISGIAIFGGLMLAKTALAWGPSDRPTYTNNAPADYATFNSITDNAAVGDERNFVRVREAGTDAAPTDEVSVEPGKTYEVYIYYHNDAGSDTNASGLGIALRTKVAATYPAKVSKDAPGTLTGEITWKYITSANDTVHDGKVWDEAYLKTDYDNVILHYDPSTATIHNTNSTNGLGLSTNLFAEGGTYIGYNELNGVIPGCAEYSGYVTYTLTAEKIDSTFNKAVSLDGKDWDSPVTVQPGDYVTYRVTFQNTGNTTLSNVIFKDAHDDGLTSVAGSPKVFDFNNENGKTIDDIIDLSGYNTGDAVPTALVQIIYQAQVNPDTSLCNKTLSNKVTVSYNSAEQKTADTTILVACEEPEPPTPPETCETNPNLPGCQEETCRTNPDLPGCQEIVPTGPLEIVMAIIVIAGIGGGGYYFYRTRKALKTVEDRAAGKDDTPPETNAEPDSDSTAA